ncbi:glycosyltransferase [Bradyrhizobium sp. CCGB12]|uniref:glycosyltransferase n=1 Tax=Bradyrhizobium sp. CCGB12 TaxID=2949632 RepID=UPI0020B3A98E|nr:glycosyltransferase [Bradyrhizobium sp. CCGB12]MCP3392312.1 glycosyltransferase [Bradyrhizobium sp. CCGB12]
MRICFLVGSLAISGGTYVIFQHAAHLVTSGHDVLIAAQEPFTPETISWHDVAGKLTCVGLQEASKHEYDLVIATWWKTALELPRFNAGRFGYFVQSIESRFYPKTEGPLRRLIDATYGLPLNFVTEAGWIRDRLATDSGRDAALVRNGIRKDIYSEAISPIEERVEGSSRVLVEGHFRVPFKNTARAISLAKGAGAKDIWLLTGTPVRWIPGVRRVFSKVPINVAARVYRSCDVLVKLSTVEGMFGPPLEMFHCGGTAVVLNVTGHEEYIRHGENAIVIADQDEARIQAAITTLLRDRSLLNTLTKGARDTASQWPSWAESSARFERWIVSLNDVEATDRSSVADQVRAAFETYERDERERLAADPSIRRGYWVDNITRRLPRSALSCLENINAVLELNLLSRPIR